MSKEWRKGDAPSNFVEWLGISSKPDWSRARFLGSLLGVILILATVILIFLAVLAAIRILLSGSSGATSSAVQPLATSAVVIVAVLGTPFVLWRAIVAQRQVDIAEQGHITDRITTAVQGLGAEKTQKIVLEDGSSRETTLPNLEVRIGSIYALERIARDSPRDHINIMEILCAYIRHNAPVVLASKQEDESNVVEPRHYKPRDDIQTIVEVLGRRTEQQRKFEGEYVSGSNNESYKLNLVGCDLRGVDFSKRNFAGAIFSGSDLSGAFLTHSNFNEARFAGCKLNHANLTHASLQSGMLFKVVAIGVKMTSCDLSYSNMIKSVISESDFSRSTLRGVKLHDAELEDVNLAGTDASNASFKHTKMINCDMRGASAVDANWRGAVLSSVIFRGADLQGCQFSGTKIDHRTRFFGAKLSGALFFATDISNLIRPAENWTNIFVSACTKLNSETARQDFWPESVMDRAAIEAAWRIWRERRKLVFV